MLVPKYGVMMKANEFEIPNNPIYAPLLYAPDRIAVTVAMKGKLQISPTQRKTMAK